MNMDAAIQIVQQCLHCVKPDADDIANDVPLLESRIISSFDVLELILHLERASGRPVTRRQLVPGSFRDINTIAQVFLMSESDR